MNCYRLPRSWGLVWILAAAGLLSPVHATQVLRYRCEMLDGSLRWVAEDLSQRYPGAVPACQAVRLEAAPLELREEALPPTAATAAAAPSVRPLLAWAPPPRPAMPATPLPIPAHRAQMLPLMHDACARQGLDCRLVYAMIDAESGFRVQARSPKGAMGLMQVMPATGQRYGVARPDTLMDPATNLDVGTRYLRDLLAMFGGRLDLAVAAYNAGEGAVIRHGRRIPPYPETQGYVRRVLGTLERLKAAGPSFGAHAGTSPAVGWPSIGLAH